MLSQRRALNVAVQIVILGSLLFALLNYQFFLDWYALHTYRPSTSVAAIESKLGLTSRAKAVFYRNSPQIDAKADFNRDCATGPGALELGCYYRGHIYILQIDNQSLASEMEVVTAHELLHAVWARMSESERSEVSSDLLAVYAATQDSELKQRMAEYAKSEPGEQANELHSILGTEYPNLPPSLEKHYAAYFTDRSVVVKAHQQYEAVFNTRRSELEAELAAIRTLKAQLSGLNARMSALRSSGQVASYNSLVPSQNRLVDDINQRIDAYSAGVREYNDLSKSLDSREITDTESGVTK